MINNLLYYHKMTRFSSFFVLTVALIMTIQLSNAQQAKPFALIELYTSQGCSSCPRADQYLSEVIENAETNNQNIIALSFHVDYWNRLGWKDPYSSEENTQRQYDYAKALKSSNVYTPQMVVNGKVEFVGGNRETGSQAIQQALTQTPVKSIELKRTLIDGQLTIEYDITGELNGEVLNIALAEKGVVTKVGRGENGGRTLKHENVVRVFKTISLSQESKGKIKVVVPGDLVKQNGIIVAFVQNKDHRQIQGANSIPLI